MMIRFEVENYPDTKVILAGDEEINFIYDTDGRRGISHNFTGKIMFKSYDITIEQTFKDGYNHSHNDCPAFFTQTESTWYNMGKIHRIGGPAIIIRNVNYRWYFLGDLMIYQTYLNFLDVEDKLMTILTYGDAH